MDALFPDSPVDPPSSLLGGDALLAKIYNAIRTATMVHDPQNDRKTGSANGSYLG
jgi:hypothetical protein